MRLVIPGWPMGTPVVTTRRWPAWTKPCFKTHDPASSKTASVSVKGSTRAGITPQDGVNCRSVWAWGVRPSTGRLVSRKIPVGIIEKDYVLSLALSLLSNSEMIDHIIFKGGTAIKKMYFPDLRFPHALFFRFKEMNPDSLSLSIQQYAC